MLQKAAKKRHSVKTSHLRRGRRNSGIGRARSIVKDAFIFACNKDTPSKKDIQQWRTPRKRVGHVKERFRALFTQSQSIEFLNENPGVEAKEESKIQATCCNHQRILLSAPEQVPLSPEIVGFSGTNESCQDILQIQLSQHKFPGKLTVGVNTSMSNHVDLTEDAEDGLTAGGSSGCLDDCPANVSDFRGMDKVVLTVKELVLCQITYVYLAEVTFTTETIKLQMKGGSAVFLQNEETISWSLDQISGFASYNNIDAGYAVVELELCSLAFCEDSSLCRGNGQSVLFKVDGAKWPEQQEQITALCDHYKRICRPLCESEHLEMIMEVFQSFNPHLEQYAEKCTRIENGTSLWRDIIYPKKDPDAVTVTRTDFDLLNPMEFLSDTVIDFYIKYLQTTLSAEQKGRFYFYNSFFFRKLTEVESSIASGIERRKVAFDGVKRWTSKTNIFDKDYLFVPVMQSAHWSLIIICHPNQLFKDDELPETSKARCILHLDSLEGCHTGIEGPIRNHYQTAFYVVPDFSFYQMLCLAQNFAVPLGKLLFLSSNLPRLYTISYLVDAWIQKFGCSGEKVDDACERLSEIEFIHAKVPQQTNYSDCGLFLLHYVELCIRQTQDIPHCLTSDWFDPAEASAKRISICELVVMLLLKDRNEDVNVESCNAMMRALQCAEDAAMPLSRMRLTNPFGSINCGVVLPLSSLQCEILRSGNESPYSGFQLESAACATSYVGPSQMIEMEHPEPLKTPIPYFRPELGGSFWRLVHVWNEMTTSLVGKALDGNMYVGAASGCMQSSVGRPTLFEQDNSPGPSSDSFLSITSEPDLKPDEIPNNTEEELQFCACNCGKIVAAQIAGERDHGPENDVHYVDMAQLASLDQHIGLEMVDNKIENSYICTIKQEAESIPFETSEDPPSVEQSDPPLDGHVIDEKIMISMSNTAMQSSNECMEEKKGLESLHHDEIITGRNVPATVNQSGQFYELLAEEQCEWRSYEKDDISQVPQRDDVRYISSDEEGREQVNQNGLNLKKLIHRGKKLKQKKGSKENLSESQIHGGPLTRSVKRKLGASLKSTMLDFVRKKRQPQCISD